MPLAHTTRRVLRSPLVDLLVGPHGIDRYLELIRPESTIHDPRGRVVSVRRQTSRTVTLTVAPNDAFTGFTAGQFVRVGVEIDGVRRTRTYSPASSQHSGTGTFELTITRHPDGLVSNYLCDHARPGMVLHLGAAQGEFRLPDHRPQELILISGGSGITPVLSLLRTLCDEGHGGEVAFIHYARRRGDFLYEAELARLEDRLAGLTTRYIATREGGARLSAAIASDHADAFAAVCGPPSLIEAASDLWPAERLINETFTPPALAVTGAAARGTLRFERSGVEAPIAQGTLLEQAEAAGLTPKFGCRMGICHTCTCRKTAGAVRNVLTGEVSGEEDEEIQLCISVPAGDVALEI